MKKMRKKLVFILVTLLCATLINIANVFAAEAGTSKENPVNVVLGQKYTKKWTNSYDYYTKFTISSKGILTMNFTKPLDSNGERGRIWVELYNDYGNKVWETRTRAAYNLAQNNYVFHVGLNPGVYYAQIGFYDNKGYPITMDYHFTFSKNNDIEVENNNTKANATLLELNHMYKSYLGYDGAWYNTDNDYYKFNAVKGKEYRIAISNFKEIEEKDIVIEIIDPSNKTTSIKKYFTQLDSSQNKYYVLKPQVTGEYYLKISYYNGLQLPYDIGVLTETRLTYQTGVQKKGWLGKVTNGVTSGTVGSGLRMEALKINLENPMYDGNIEYKTHIQKKGWESSWKKNGEMSGTQGLALRLEALQIRLTGEMAKHYDIYYRVHAQQFGWLDWTKNGATAGTMGFGLRLEAIQIKLVKKGSSAPGSTNRPSVTFGQSSVTYQTQVQKKGWLGKVTNGVTSGTVGSGLRMETLRVNLNKQEVSGNIEYRTHIQKKGWESSWKKNGEMSGTQGQGLRLEAVQIKLTGEMAKKYDIYYRVHAQKFGWLGWAKNGESAGTAGYGYRLEAIQIKLVKKGSSAPGKTANHYYSV